MPSPPKSLSQRLYSEPVTIASGAAQNFDTRGFNYITILSPAGTTTTYSRVNSIDASAHVTDPATATSTVASDTMEAIAVDWPFFRVSAASGPCDVCLV